MSKWGRLIELLIVILVALLAAFGLIYGYQVVCSSYGMCSGSSASILNPEDKASVSRELARCTASDTPPAGCTCYSINAGGESHEYNVTMYSPAIVAVRAKPAPGYPVSGGENPMRQVSLSVVVPASEWRNDEVTRCVASSADGGVFESICPFWPLGRYDFRIFFRNDSRVPVSYCLYTNGAPS